MHMRTKGDVTFRDLNKNGKLDPYEYPRRPIEEHIEDLLAQKTQTWGRRGQTVVYLQRWAESLNVDAIATMGKVPLGITGANLVEHHGNGCMECLTCSCLRASQQRLKFRKGLLNGRYVRRVGR